MFLETLYPPAVQGLYPRTTWHVCKLAHGEPIVSVHEYDAFVITGSRFNVRDGKAGSLPWFEPLCMLIRQIAGVAPAPPLPGGVDALSGSPAAAAAAVTQRRLYGACFGHQIVAHALGGQVDANPQVRNLCVMPCTIRAK